MTPGDDTDNSICLPGLEAFRSVSAGPDGRMNGRSSPAVSPVSRTPRPACAEERTTPATCGPPCSGLFAPSGQRGFWSRMCGAFSRMAPPSASVMTWIEQVTKRGRSWWQPRIVGLGTGDRGCGLSPTLLSGSRGARVRPRQTTNGKQLVEIVRWALSPTPTAETARPTTVEACERVVERRQRGGRSLPLQGVVILAGGPTLEAPINSESGSGYSPTPTASDGKNSGSRMLPNRCHNGITLTDLICRPQPGPAIGNLNPLWVAQYMGYPDGWLDQTEHEL